MICALVLNNEVVNIVTVNSDDEYFAAMSGYDLAVDVTDYNPIPIPGWMFDGNKLYDPSGLSKPLIKMSKLKFLERFTDTELATIEGFAGQSNAYAYALRSALRKQSLAAYMDLSLPQTIAGVNNLVALGLLTSARATVILTTPITELEKYKGIE